MQNSSTTTQNSFTTIIHLRPPNTKEEMEEMIMKLRELFSKNIEDRGKMLIEMLPKEPTSFGSQAEFEEEQKKYSYYMKIYKEQVIILLDQIN